MFSRFFSKSVAGSKVFHEIKTVFSTTRSKFSQNPFTSQFRSYRGRSSYSYEEPPWWKRWYQSIDDFFQHSMPSFLQAPAAVYSMLVPNLMVFGAWSWYRSGRDFKGTTFMQRNFMLHGKSGWHTLLTHSFSHIDGFHLLFNMFSLFTFGSSICNLVGAAEFLTLYLGSALVAGAAQRMNNPKSYSLGASGAVYSLMSAYALAFPMRTIYIYFIPVPAILAVGGLVLLDYLRLGSHSGVGHSAHLTGAACGALFWAARVRGRFYGL